MALTSISDLKNLFRTGLKPAQTAFWNIIDSFWHKGDTIPSSAVAGLDAAIQSIPNKGELLVDGTATYSVPANEFLDFIVVVANVNTSIQIGQTAGGNELYEEQLLAGESGTFDGRLFYASTTTLYFTGQFTAKLYFR